MNTTTITTRVAATGLAGMIMTLGGVGIGVGGVGTGAAAADRLALAMPCEVASPGPIAPLSPGDLSELGLPLPTAGTAGPGTSPGPIGPIVDPRFPTEVTVVQPPAGGCAPPTTTSTWTEPTTTTAPGGGDTIVPGHGGDPGEPTEPTDEPGENGDNGDPDDTDDTATTDPGGSGVTGGGSAHQPPAAGDGKLADTGYGAGMLTAAFVTLLGAGSFLLLLARMVYRRTARL